MTDRNPKPNGLLGEIQTILANLSFADSLKSTTISEKAIGDRLRSALSRNGYRIATRVRPSKLATDLPGDTRKAVQVLIGYRHSLQPDIDSLIEDSNRRLWGFELKLIRWAEQRRKPVVHVGRFYDGLGQAIAFATCGMDFACLVHVFVIPVAAYRKLEAEDPVLGETTDDERVEYFLAYTGIINGILERFDLPIGYVALAVAADARSVSVGPMLPWKEPSRLGATATGNCVRNLLLRALAKRETTFRIKAR